MISPEIQDQLRRWQTVALGIGFSGLLLCGLGVFLDPRQALRSHLFAFVFWFGLSLGCLTLALIHHLTGGTWGFLVRRFLEAGFLTLPVMALLFIPLAAGVRELYPWSQAGTLAAGEALHDRQWYLNQPAFVARATVCFSFWLLLARCLRRWSLDQDSTTGPEPTIRLRTLSGPALVFHVLLATFAFIDWVMAIDTEWYSSIFPVIILTGQLLSAVALAILMLNWLAHRPPFRGIIEPRHQHDLANLLLAFVMFWTYVSFSQYLIVYSGNLPAEIRWYQQRSAPGWVLFLGLLALFHFVVPFLLLLSRSVKNAPRLLGAVATLVFLAQLAAVFWMIAPMFSPEAVRLHWLDFAAVAGIGGLWCARFLAALKKHPLLPRNDPRLEYTLPITAHAK